MCTCSIHAKSQSAHITLYVVCFFTVCYKTYFRKYDKVLAELMAAHAKPNALLRGAKGSPYVEAGDHERRWRTKTIQSMEDHIVKVEGELKALPLAQTELNETDGRLTAEVSRLMEMATSHMK